jgi:hypothetical protein
LIDGNCQRTDGSFPTFNLDNFRVDSAVIVDGTAIDHRAQGGVDVVFHLAMAAAVEFNKEATATFLLLRPA